MLIGSWIISKYYTMENTARGLSVKLLVGLIVDLDGSQFDHNLNVDVLWLIRQNAQ